MGNLFAVRPGWIEGPPIAMGSHLDTQPNGGRYDGILEVLRAVHEVGSVTEHPVAVVIWTDEEGARSPCSEALSGPHDEGIQFG
jgi:acetylornithine deacetylase/succinyl-diaminopimelate desuccinylase-like protein